MIYRLSFYPFHAGAVRAATGLTFFAIPPNPPPQIPTPSHLFGYLGSKYWQYIAVITTYVQLLGKLRFRLSTRLDAVRLAHTLQLISKDFCQK